MALPPPPPSNKRGGGTKIDYLEQRNVAFGSPRKNYTLFLLLLISLLFFSAAANLGIHE